jgi:hypothetical protein
MELRADGKPCKERAGGRKQGDGNGKQKHKRQRRKHRPASSGVAESIPQERAESRQQTVQQQRAESTQHTGDRRLYSRAESRQQTADSREM